MVRYEAFVGRGWRDMGITLVMIARTPENGWVEAAVFLVNFWCLGVKDVFSTKLSAPDWADQAAQLMPPESREAFSPACARQLVEGAVAYALALGFPPPRGYKKALRVFGGVKAQTCSQTFTYGKAGKPLYIAGPNEDSESIARVLCVLTEKLGVDGFHYIVPARTGQPDPVGCGELQTLFPGRPGGTG